MRFQNDDRTAVLRMNPSITIKRCETNCKSDQEISEFLQNLNLVVLVDGAQYDPEVYDGTHVKKYIQAYTQKVFQSPGVMNNGVIWMS